MRGGSKRVLGTTILAGFVYAGWRKWRTRLPTTAHDLSWDGAPFPFPPVPRPARDGSPSAEIDRAG